MEQNIKPITKTLTGLTINAVSVVLDTEAFVTFSMIGDEVGFSGQLVMSGEAYEAWGNDDEYVLNWTMEQLGVEPA